MENNLDNIYNIFIKWFALPESMRNPRNMESFAEHYNITLSTLAEFQDKESFSDDLLHEARQWGKTKIPELLHIVYAKLKSSDHAGGKINDLKIFKELLVDDEKDKKGSGNTYNLNVFNPSDEQYRQILARETRLLTEGSTE